ncbi:MFS transporter [Arthrobacter sp. MYb224]|uniref:MFS transporter n=1 Tax=Micrococcaceae TaxID=1268 RepID=UPI000CFC00E3|nr:MULTISPECIES: MFS transporter [unclassified Arthrobacter]PQZ97564.1 MFS transporter [Arthrobacter sp. MYb224]PRA04205.1 MFS transporter [Arthrobacter sp. MYb229]PRB51883.1 MFS transporter [Arthrobacter sp. MYb216]
MSKQAKTTTKRSPEVVNKIIFRRIMPLLIAAYVMAFIDRTNIGMAKDRMEIDLGISATAYGIGAGLFFLTYALSEIPSNLIMHKVGARFWIMRIMITWGILSACMAFVQGEWSFYILRMLLGIAEAGLFPGVIYFITQWFVVKDRAKANGMFLLGVSIANIVGAPLGGVLLTLDGLGGLHGWQWMFIIEGIPACILAFVVWKCLPNKPTESKFLTREEAEDLEASILAEETAGAKASGNSKLRHVLKDKQILLVVAIYFTHQIAVYALSFFLPSIIGTYGALNTIQIGLLTSIPWIFSAAGALLLPRLATNASRSRLIATSTMVGIVAGFTLGAIGGPILGMIGFCLAAFNFFALQPILFTYPATRLSGAALAGGIAFVNTIGLFGGFLGPYVMGFMEEATGSKISGLWFIVAMCTIGALLTRKLKRGTEDPAKSSVAAH